MEFEKICSDVSRVYYDAPTIELRRLFSESRARVLLKLPPSHATGSIKDVAAGSILDAGEALGFLTPQTQIVEATSGAWGVALACVAAVRGYDLTLVAPENLSNLKRRAIEAFGAKLILTPERQGFTGARRVAQEKGQNDSNVWIPDFFANPSNPASYEATLGPSLWRATDGRIDYFISYVGSGGAFIGTTRYLRRRDPKIKFVAVESRETPVLSSGRSLQSEGTEGFGSRVVPPLFFRSYVSSIESASTEEARDWARRLARKEGVLVGLTTGANLAVVARLVAQRENRGKTFVTLAFDCGVASQ